MSIPFAIFFKRLCTVTDIKSQMDLAKALEVNRSAVTQAKVRNSVPQKWVLLLARRYALSPDWLEYGTGSPRPQNSPWPKTSSAKKSAVKSAPAATANNRFGNSFGNNFGSSFGNHTAKGGVRLMGAAVAAEGTAEVYEGEIINVPMASARLCAGGGSFEVDATPVAAYPFPRWWLAKMGSPLDMVFMEVVGDSMEPTIYDGDTVLVDQSSTRLDPHGIFAVGVEDAIYLKRVQTAAGKVFLHSDNTAHAPMELLGDELESFRVIGKVVWMCRDCR